MRTAITTRLSALGTLIAFAICAAPMEPRPALHVILHRDNPVDSVTREQLRRIVLGEERFWPNREKITVVQQESSSLAFQRMLQDIAKLSPAEYARWMVGGDFRGEAPPRIKVLNSEEGALKFVYNVPGAITISTTAPPPELLSGLKVVKVDNRLPDQKEYPLR